MSRGLTACQALLCTLGAKPVLLFGAGILMGVCVCVMVLMGGVTMETNQQDHLWAKDKCY